MEDVVIVSAVRTPIGKFQGSLSDFTRSATGRHRRAGGGQARRNRSQHRGRMHHGQRGICRTGTESCAPGGAGRRAVDGVSAMTINKVCGSGLKAVALAQQAIQTGNSEIVVAGGMESMTNAPYLLPLARKGFRLGDQKVIDSMVHDGLWDVYNDYHMGNTGENVAEKYTSPARSRTNTRSTRIARPSPRSRSAASKIRLCRWSCHRRRRALTAGVVHERRVAARGHHRRSAACAEAGVQEGRHRDGRQCARGE